MKRILILTLVSMMTILSGCTSSGGNSTDASKADAQKPIVYKISAGLPDSHFEIAALKEMEKHVESVTNGEIDIEIYSNNQLGDDKEAIELIQQGVVQMCPSGTSALSNFEKSFNILSSPYLFKNIDDIGKILGGEWGEELLNTLSSSGLKGLGYGVLGLTNISNNVRPIENVDDYNGLKLRCVPNPVLLDFFKAVGANPVSMSFNELFSAMQQGVIDGQFNPMTTIQTNNFQEVQKYISKTGDIASLVVFVVNDAEFAKLKPEHQTALMEGVEIATNYMAESVVKEETDAEKILAESGKTTINEVSDDVKNELFEKGYSVIEKYGKESNEDLFNKLMKELGVQ